VLPRFAALGASVFAFSPQPPARSRDMIEKNGLGFDILSDPGNAYAAALGLRFTVAPEVQAVYRSMGLDLAVINGEDSWTLPMPARIVVDRRGIVRVVDADPDYTRRPEPEKTLADVAALATP
jgi:peroxiredoxin